MAELVLATGTYTVKAGYADVVERTLLPSIEMPSSVRRSEGEAPTQLVEGGEVRDWAGLEVLWRHVLYEQLGWIEGEEGNVLLTEPRGLSRLGKECMAQLLFEQLNVNGAFFAEESVLSLYAVGKVSGLVVDVGHASTGVVAVADGQPLPHGSTEISFGGRQMSALMQEALERGGVSDAVMRGATFDRVYDANALGCHTKEKAARVAATEEEYDAAVASSSGDAETFTLPDGSTITLRRRDRLSVGESLFRPGLVMHETAHGPGVVEAAVQALMSCPTEQRRLIMDQIVVCGGSSMLDGFRERLLGELNECALGSQKPTIVAVPEYLDSKSTMPYASWVGGAILAKHVFPQNQHITRYDYNENGPARAVRGFTKSAR